MLIINTLRINSQLQKNMNWFLVFIGGGLGSLLRFGLSILLKNTAGTFPVSTLVSNVTASFIIGILAGWGLKNSLSEEYKWLLATGFCGGFSTFSTFSNETVQLFQNGNGLNAFINIFISIALCLSATILGLKMC